VRSRADLQMQAKFADGGLILGSSQFTLLPQLPLTAMLDLKNIEIDSKIMGSLLSFNCQFFCYIK